MKRLHRILYLWHRYVGLAMALFLVIVALTGTILAFSPQLNRVFAPQIYAKIRPGVPRLDLAALINRIQEQVPTATVRLVGTMPPDRAYALAAPKKNPATGKPYDDPGTIWADPWTGKILGTYHRSDDLSQGGMSVIPFILHIHERLLTRGGWGSTFLGIVALFWLVDCFVALYLTMPPVLSRFFHHWKPSWLIKANAGPYRLNLDLHRAFGLWLWPIVLIFAASSVMYNLPSVWRPLMSSLFGSPGRGIPIQKTAANARKGAKSRRQPDWNRALAEGQRLLAGLDAAQGLAPGTPGSLSYAAATDTYGYSENLGQDGRLNRTVTFDLEKSEVLTYSGKQEKQGVPTDQFIDGWLRRLHTADNLGLLYQTFVAFLGLVITMFSVTGVYLWWKKWSIRRARRKGGERGAVPAAGVGAMEAGS